MDRRFDGFESEPTAKLGEEAVAQFLFLPIAVPLLPLAFLPGGGFEPGVAGVIELLVDGFLRCR